MKLRMLVSGFLVLAVASPAVAADEKSLLDRLGEAAGDFFHGRQLESAEKLAAPANAYDKALFEGYLALSRAEFAEADYRDSDVFARRAMRASRGERFQPEAISARDLPTDLLNLAARRRQDLIIAQLRGVAEGIPDWSAEAQLSFDCWMQEQEEDFQIDDIAACVERFDLAMEKLGVFLDPTPIPEARVELERFVAEVFFDLDSAKLNADAQTTIAAFAAWVPLYSDPVVAVIGNADQVGATDYNFELSQRRANVVATTLKSLGIPVEGIFARGDQAPAIDRVNRAPERLNRRVIMIVREG